MPNLSKADQAALVTTTEARRRKETALAGLRMLELGKPKGELLPCAEVIFQWRGKAVAVAQLRTREVAGGSHSESGAGELC